MSANGQELVASVPDSDDLYDPDLDDSVSDWRTEPDSDNVDTMDGEPSGGATSSTPDGVASPRHSDDGPPWKMVECPCCGAIRYKSSAHRARAIYHCYRNFDEKRPAIDTRKASGEDSLTPDVSAEDTLDDLARLPTEIRLIIFEFILQLPRPIFRADPTWDYFRVGEYGLENNKLKSEQCSVSILGTCRQYHKEGTKILYGKNKLVFAAGNQFISGYFERFPVSRQYIPFLRDITVMYHLGDPAHIDTRKVAYFISAIGRLGKKIKDLTVCGVYDHTGPTSLNMFYEMGHPVVKALMDLMTRQNVKTLNIRVHGSARFAPGVLNVMYDFFQMFQNKGMTMRFFKSRGFCPCQCDYMAEDSKDTVALRKCPWEAEEVFDPAELEEDDISYEEAMAEIEEELWANEEEEDDEDDDEYDENVIMEKMAEQDEDWLHSLVPSNDYRAVRFFNRPVFWDIDAEDPSHSQMELTHYFGAISEQEYFRRLGREPRTWLATRPASEAASD